ncbi:glycosyl hydrolase family 17 protein [Aliiglaciecola sp. M165]|uniref:glycoside hydrolase family 17 protein n=1 Tax=Aliiglaciecola sp. M165 TaxID=2593649 RepID=UPI001180DBB5|nr:glycosyl hydrolase family 17 protein [Aliiglaciecola sp. M165]TRY31728.1 glycosyl hydrolase [Aliiglaciecola sp. M165]
MSSRYYRRRNLAGINYKSLSLDQKKQLVSERLKQKIHGISFSPYIRGQGPGTEVTEELIDMRLSIISPYVNWIRTFSCTEGNQLIPKVAAKKGLKSLVGVWLSDDLEKNEVEILNAIEVAKSGHADMMGVGNEVLLRGELTPDQLIDYIKRVQTAAPGVPVGYVDAYFEFVDYPEIADACDVIFANCYPFWEGYPIEHALIYMKDMYRRAQSVAKGKPVVISETGWPNVGSPERGSVPSYNNAIEYFLSTYKWADEEDINIFYFSSFDEAWKVEDEGDVGAFWGLWDEEGKAKYGQYDD